MSESTSFVPSLIAASRRPETMQIASDDTESGFVIINVSDFDAETMTVFGVEPPPAPLPSVRNLATALEGLSLDDVYAMQGRDERPSAAPIYAARIAELSAE